MHRIKYVGHFEIGFFSSCNGPINIRNVLMENNRGTKLGRGAKMRSIHIGSCTFNMCVCVCHFISAFEATWKKISQLTLLLLADALIYSQSILLLSEDVRVCGWRVVWWGEGPPTSANIPNNGPAAAARAQLGDEKCSWSNQLQLGRQLKRKSGVLRVFAVINCRCAAAAKWSTALQCCSAAVTPALQHVVTGEQCSIMLMFQCISNFHVFGKFFSSILNHSVPECGFEDLK